MARSRPFFFITLFYIAQLYFLLSDFIAGFRSYNSKIQINRSVPSRILFFLFISISFIQGRMLPRGGLSCMRKIGSNGSEGKTRLSCSDGWLSCSRFYSWRRTDVKRHSSCWNSGAASWPITSRKTSSSGSSSSSSNNNRNLRYAKKKDEMLTGRAIVFIHCLSSSFRLDGLDHLRKCSRADGWELVRLVRGQGGRSIALCGQQSQGPVRLDQGEQLQQQQKRHRVRPDGRGCQLRLVED